MTQPVYCLECNAVIGEEPERGEGEPGDDLAVCQTCAQHRHAEGGASPRLPEDSPASGL